MRILFDQGTPLPLRNHLLAHSIDTAYGLGWSDKENGERLDSAEQADYDVVITTDQNLRYQQNLSDRRIAIVVLHSTSWPRIQQHITEIVQAIDGLQSGAYVEIAI